MFSVHWLKFDRDIYLYQLVLHADLNKIIVISNYWLHTYLKYDFEMECYHFVFLLFVDFTQNYLSQKKFEWLLLKHKI